MIPTSTQGAARAGYSYSIVRPGRLVGGPWTNPDFAQLLKADVGEKQGVEIKRGDPDGFAGEKYVCLYV